MAVELGHPPVEAAGLGIAAQDASIHRVHEICRGIPVHGERAVRRQSQGHGDARENVGEVLAAAWGARRYRHLQSAGGRRTENYAAKELLSDAINTRRQV